MGDTTQAERYALVNDLDAAWVQLGYKDLHMKVIGWLSFPKQVDQTYYDVGEETLTQYSTPDNNNRYTIDTSYYDGVVMRSNGYCWMPDDIELHKSVIPRWS